MPPHADHVLRHGYARTQTRHLDQLAEFHVFDNVHAQPAVPSAFLIGGPAHKLECADSHVASRTCIGSLPGLVADDESESKISNRGNFPESSHLDGGKQRQVIPLSLLSQRDPAAQRSPKAVARRLKKGRVNRKATANEPCQRRRVFPE